MKKENKYWYVLLILLISVILIITVKLVNFEKPYANAIIELRDVPNEEYMKEIYVEVSVLNVKNISRDIFIPQLLAIDKLDRLRSKKVDSSEISNMSSANAQSISRVVFDMENLTFEQIKECYNDEVIIARVLTNKGKELSFTFNIGELLTDKTGE